MKKSKKYILTDEYLQDVLVRLAHHSSAIEGNTISLADTVSIILHDTIPGNTSKREYFEIENHREAFRYVIDHVANGVEMSITVIKDIHERLTDRLLVDKGQFKQSENAILGAEFPAASPRETPTLMKQWVDNLNYQLKHAQSQKDIISVVGDFHIQFERIHPFSDGNGRTGRMLMNYSLLEKGSPPLIIRAEDKAEYVNILANSDIAKFTQFATQRIQEESKRLERFMNMNEKAISDPKSTKNHDLEL
ncbi:cell filamentation protein Fic [Virgibacillus dokdonensis]|uniref:Cell filamentation protein Fic n=1 Tax=Virgibacillus dokdonensis TaxID=302167 RepID=A0A3E0WIS2_9BACI|nr:MULTISPECIES: Fic family protein [Virgibacillus]RFA31765.1 cell filamentation protein Fic [Virgibacillus dokdonensis]